MPKSFLSFFRKVSNPNIWGEPAKDTRTANAELPLKLQSQKSQPEIIPNKCQSSHYGRQINTMLEGKYWMIAGGIATIVSLLAYDFTIAFLDKVYLCYKNKLVFFFVSFFLCLCL